MNERFFHPRPLGTPASRGQCTLSFGILSMDWKLSPAGGGAQRTGVENLKSLTQFSILFFILLFLTSCQNDPPNQSTASIKTIESTEEKVIYQDPFLSSTDAFVKKYQGKIGDDEIELTLVNLENGLLEGSFFYKKSNKKIDLSGELGLDESFVLETFEDDDYLGKFEGNLKELNTLSGNWSNADSTQSTTYELKEIPFNDQSGWTGAWYRNINGSRGLLVIGNVTKKKFDFGMEVYNGGHNGIMEGTAMLNSRIGTFKANVFDDSELCNIIFQKKEDHIIVMQKSSTVACGFGMRANADGKYENRILE